MSADATTSPLLRRIEDALVNGEMPSFASVMAQWRAEQRACACVPAAGETLCPTCFAPPLTRPWRSFVSPGQRRRQLVPSAYQISIHVSAVREPRATSKSLSPTRTRGRVFCVVTLRCAVAVCARRPKPAKQRTDSRPIRRSRGRSWIRCSCARSSNCSNAAVGGSARKKSRRARFF